MPEAEDFEVPPPKRLCTQSSEPAFTSDQSDNGDDFDDIYDTPPRNAMELPEASALPGPTQAKSLHDLSSMPTLLPGLGKPEPNGVAQDEVLQNISSEQPITLDAAVVLDHAENEVSTQILQKPGGGETRLKVGGEQQTKNPISLSNPNDEIPVMMEHSGLQGQDILMGLLGGASSEHEGNHPIREVQMKTENAMEATQEGKEEDGREGVDDVSGYIRGLDQDAALPKQDSVDQSVLISEVAQAVAETRFKEDTVSPQSERTIIRQGSDAPNETREQEKHMTRPNFVEAAKSEHAHADAEFELDSSPLSSTSDSSGSSTDDDSDSDSEDEENDEDAYPLLSPEEQARRLMAEDAESEDDVQGKGRNSRGLRTQNEKPDEEVPKPEVTVTEDMKILELGGVENIVENLILIKASVSGEYSVLESGSVLCLQDRTVIGAVAETLGRVQQPYYSVRFSSSTAIAEAGVAKDVRIFYVADHSTTVFTQTLKATKGSDASNIHDEEVADDELEFSDDEAEAEHRRRIKTQRQARRFEHDGRTDGFAKGPRGNGGTRSGLKHKNVTNNNPKDGQRSLVERPEDRGGTALNYDDGPAMTSDTEDLYTPLPRPANLHEMMDTQGVQMENPARQPRTGDKRGQNWRGRNDRGGSHGVGSRGGRNRRHGPPAGHGHDRFNSSHKTLSSSHSGRQGHASASSPPPPHGLPPKPDLPVFPVQTASSSPATANTYSSPHPQVGAHTYPTYPPQNGAVAPPTWQQPQPSQSAAYFPNAPTLQYSQNQGYPPHQQPHSHSHPHPYAHAQPPQPPQLLLNQIYPYSSNAGPPFYHAAPVSAPPIPAGAHINPSFFRQQQYQQDPQHPPSWLPNGNGNGMHG